MRFEFIAICFDRKGRIVAPSYYNRKLKLNSRKLKINLKTIGINRKTTVRKERGKNRALVKNFAIPRQMRKVIAKSAASLGSF